MSCTKKNGWTDRDAVWDAELGGPRKTGVYNARVLFGALLGTAGWLEGNSASKTCRNYPQRFSFPNKTTTTTTTTTTATTILQPLYRTTCVRRQTQLTTGGLRLSKVLLPPCPWWWQLAHSDQGGDARVLHTGVTCTISVPLPNKCKKKSRGNWLTRVCLKIMYSKPLKLYNTRKVYDTFQLSQSIVFYLY